MKIIRLEAENVKRLQAVEITPDGALVQICGANGSGKSSVLDSIWWALAGAKNIQSQPVRHGAENARITLDMGELVVTRRFTPSGTTITVEDAGGKRFPSPQKMLDELLGSLSFDPLGFARMDPKAQYEQLRRLVKIEADLDALDAANKRDYERRTEAGRELKRLEGQLAGAPVPPPGLPDAPVDVADLMDQMARVAEVNAGIEQRALRRQQAAAKVTERRTQAKAKRAQAEVLLREAEQLEEAATMLEAELAGAEPLPAPTSVAELREQIAAAEATNRHIQQRDAREKLKGEVRAAQRLVETITAQMAVRDREKAAAIAAAAMPVEGLSLGDGEVLYNGVPFEQASSAQQLRVSAAIAMAANPALRVLRIKDGSLLDPEGLAMLGAMAEAQDYQIWIERVDTTGAVGIVMEDGAVKAVRGEAA